MAELGGVGGIEGVDESKEVKVVRGFAGKILTHSLRPQVDETLHVV